MRNIRNTFKKPKVPWNSAQIKEDRILMKKYGLRRKKELWKTQGELRIFRGRARKLIAANDKEKEKVLVDKMINLGLLDKKSGLDDILALDITNILDRRLQSIVVNKGFVGGVKTARQCIVHGHILVNGRRIKFPSYFVASEEEGKIEWSPTSKLKGRKDIKQKGASTTIKEEKKDRFKPAKWRK